MPEIPLVPAHWRFPARPASVRRARHAVAESLPDVLRPHLGDDLGLLTSELLTNAIRHGACGEDGDLVEPVLWPADGHYWLAVSDPGGGKPEPARPDTDSESGRGLILIRAAGTPLGVDTGASPTPDSSVTARKTPGLAGTLALVRGGAGGGAGGGADGGGGSGLGGVTAAVLGESACVKPSKGICHHIE